jgi:hypothetical protein
VSAFGRRGERRFATPELTLALRAGARQAGIPVERHQSRRHFAFLSSSRAGQHPEDEEFYAKVESADDVSRAALERSLSIPTYGSG